MCTLKNVSNSPNKYSCSSENAEVCSLVIIVHIPLVLYIAVYIFVLLAPNHTAAEHSCNKYQTYTIA